MVCTHWQGSGLLPPYYSSKGIQASERIGASRQVEPILWPTEGQGLLSSTISLQLMCVYVVYMYVYVCKCIKVYVSVYKCLYM